LNLVGWEKIPWRLAAVLGAFTKENQRANPRTIPNKDLSAFSQTKYKFFLEAPFEIAPNCCSVMKRHPSHDYCRETGRKPISAQMASESRLRTQQWLRSGCNGFDLKYPMSNPMAFWDSQDCLLYIRLYNLPIAPVYDRVVTEDELNGQMTLFPYDAEEESRLFAPDRTRLYTTGCDRTGCCFCGFGCHLEKRPNRYELIDMVSNPAIRDFCMRGGAFTDDGMWKPDNRGLGMWFVIRWINLHGGLNIYIPDYEKYEREYGNETTQKYLYGTDKAEIVIH